MILHELRFREQRSRRCSRNWRHHLIHFVMIALSWNHKSSWIHVIGIMMRSVHWFLSLRSSIWNQLMMRGRDRCCHMNWMITSHAVSQNFLRLLFKKVSLPVVLFPVRQKRSFYQQNQKKYWREKRIMKGSHPSLFRIENKEGVPAVGCLCISLK